MATRRTASGAFYLPFSAAPARRAWRKSLSHRIALWDTIASCEITGSSDSSIRNAQPTDLGPILQGADIRQIFCNGATSYQLYCRYQQPLTGIEAKKLPSTSPANAAWSLDRLLTAWRVLLPPLLDP